jgi:outer membrane protein TolC
MWMEYMEFSCAKVLYAAFALVAVAAASAYPQALPVDLSAAKIQAMEPTPQTLQAPPKPDASPTTQPQDAAVTAQLAVSPNGAQPLRLTFKDALDRARKNSTQFLAAVTNAGILREDRIQARDALLPSVEYHNSYIKTPSPGAAALSAGAPPVTFIANNAPREYLSQGNAHEAFDFAGLASWRRAAAAAAVARAQVEIAARGLVVTVAQDYYKVGAAQSRLQIAQTTADEGDKFFKLTQDLEHGGEVAHSDVIKAELQMQDRKRQLQEAQLALLNAKLDLAVLIFPNFNENFEIVDDLHAAAPMPTFEDIQLRAGHDNPDVRAALASVQQSGYDVFNARAGYLPTLNFDYFYGIDAERFAINSSINGQKFSNLGSSVVATVNIPIWNWGATQSKVRQAELRRAQAKRELSLAQRKLLAEIQSLYAEASTAFSELDGLQRSAELAGESLRLTNLRYKNGEATVLEVVDAQTTFSAANSAYQDGALRYRVALASLQTLTGVPTNP